jgi:signal transduction histidine kinase
MLRDVDGIVADTRRLTDILEDLLLAADTREPLPLVAVDLGQLAVHAVSSARAEAEARKVQLELRRDPDVVLEAGSATALTRALTALVDNALSHARLRVRLAVTRTEDAVVVSVQDDGPGIPMEVVPRLFTRFASDRADSAAETGRRHYGLGLSLVSEVALRHGGRVTAVDRTGSSTGAELRLVLPVRGPGAKSIRARS